MVRLPPDAEPSSGNLAQDLGYKYPGGLDLIPESDLHKNIVAEVMQRANESHGEMQTRTSSWDKIDEVLKGFVPLSQEEQDIRDADDRKPVSMTIPVSFSILNTLITYMSATFFADTFRIFRYTGQGPEDEIGATLLEMLIGHQCVHTKAELALRCAWRDGFMYGIGACVPVWITEKGKFFGLEPVIEDDGFGGSEVTGQQRVSKSGVIFEGNRIDNIDPRALLPDTSIPIHRVQEGEYIGWVVRDNRFSLLSQEQEKTSGMFNARYLREIDGKSKIFPENERTATSRLSGSVGPAAQSNVVDVIHMYIQLIPEEWGLGDSEKPEKWEFMVAGEEVLLQARKLTLNHGMFPIAICAPDYDGYSVAPIGRLEAVQGLQEAVDWLFSSHVHNVRKVVNDTIIIDPSRVDVGAFKESKPGGLIPLRLAAFGTDPSTVAHQLQINDVTRNNVNDAAMLMDQMKNISGAVDILQGAQRKTSERVSATEAGAVRAGALSRLEDTARIISTMFMHDLAVMLASNTQQFMSRKQSLRVVGEWETILRETYKREGNDGEIGSSVAVGPESININWDVQPHDGSIVKGEFADTWIQMFQIIMSNPELNQMFDVGRIFKHIARLMGAKNVEDFMRDPGDTASSPNAATAPQPVPQQGEIAQ